MAELHVRRALTLDARGVAALLTALAAPAQPLVADEVQDWMATPGTDWRVAETAGRVVGVQWTEPSASLPADAARIATFAGPGERGLAVGAALWSATRAAAAARRLRVVEAHVARGNEGALVFYRSRGFERVADAPDGRLVMAWRR